MKYLSMEKLVGGKYIHISKEECDIEEPLFSDPKVRIVLKEYVSNDVEEIKELEDFTRFLPEYYVKDEELIKDDRPLYEFHYLSLQTKDSNGRIKIIKGNDEYYQDNSNIIRSVVNKKAHSKEEIESMSDFSRWLTLFDDEYRDRV